MPHVPQPLRGGVRSPRTLSPTTSAARVPELTVSMPKRQPTPQPAPHERSRLGLGRVSLRKWDVDPQEIFKELFDGSAVQ